MPRRRSISIPVPKPLAGPLPKSPRMLRAAAHNAANLLVEADVQGIMNFAPTQIRVPSHVVLRNVFFTAALDNLVYHLSN